MPYFNNSVRNFNPSKSGIKIGRASDCEVVINDKNLSRYQCRVYFNSMVGWILHDGNIKSNSSMEYAPSRNGTWIFVQTEMAIYDGLVFKNNEYLFDVSLN